MSQSRFIVSDALAALATLDAGSVDLVVTSPPFLALRSYLPAEHPHKPHEIGAEATPGTYIDALLDVTEAVARVLAPHGSLCVELGDTYSGSGGSGGDYQEGGLRADQPAFVGSSKRASEPGRAGRASMVERAAGGHHFGGDGWPLEKCLCLVPELYRLALVYGRNPLTGRSTERWRVRNVVRWHRTNPPVGVLSDKFRPSTSDLVVACKSRKRYFDLDAVRVPYQTDGGTAWNSKDGPNPNRVDNGAGHFAHGSFGAPPLDTWIIAPQPYQGAHYAAFPPALVQRPVLAMCPHRVCRTCGEPSRRMVEPSEYATPREATGRPVESLGSGHRSDRPNAEPVTVGWTDCGHDDWRRGVVLDPFAGSGTTLSVASGHGRDSIGIDLDERNGDLARERIGMFVTVEYPPAGAA